MTLNTNQTKLCDDNTTDFSDLKAVFFNCTLKKQEASSHTGILLSVAKEIMSKNGVEVDVIHPASHQIAYGVYPDMTEHGWDRDDWPAIWKKVAAADILILGTPIWLGEESSVCRIIIERLYGMSGELNVKGQSSFYGKVGGAVITGNEDTPHHKLTRFTPASPLPSPDRCPRRPTSTPCRTRGRSTRARPSRASPRARPA